MKQGLRSGRHFLRFIGDFALAMLAIWLLSLAAAVHHGRTFLLFSLIVAAIATLDLAFLRHLRRADASPRRGVWRRERTFWAGSPPTPPPHFELF
jgi:hypothetical protein